MHRLFSILLLYCIVFQYTKGSSINDTLPFQHKNERLLKFGATAGRFAVRDMETSPLIYKGTIPGFQMGASFYGKKSIAFFNFNYSYGKLATKNFPETDNNQPSAYNSISNLGYGRSVRFKFAPKSDFFLGANLSLIANFRNNPKFNNANFNYEGFSPLGPILIWERNVLLGSKQANFKYAGRKRSIKWAASAFIPVISGVARPAYPVINDFVDSNSNDFSLNQIKIVSFNRLVCLQFTSSVTYSFQNGNGFMLSYLWYYYNYYPAQNKVNGVAGTFNFSFLFKLNKNNVK